MRRFLSIAVMAVATCSVVGCGTIAQTALGVPVMMAKVAEVPLRHTQEMTRIAAGAAVDTTKHVAGEAIRAGASERIAAKNAQAQVQIAQIQAQQAQILAQQEQLRIQQAQMQAQLAQSRSGAGTHPTSAPNPVTETSVATVASAPAPRGAAAPPTLAAVTIQRNPAPPPAPVSSPAVTNGARPTASPASPMPAPVQLADASTPSSRTVDTSLSFDELRAAQRRAAMQRMAQITPTWTSQP